MNTEPDGFDVVATAADAGSMPPLLVVDTVEKYLDGLGIGDGPLQWQRIGDGQSNVTFLLRRGDRQVVLRRGPRPPIPRSTHDMLREARLQKLLAPAGVPVPEIIDVCEDESLLGVPFYLMEFVDGDIVTTDLPAGYESEASRRRLAEVVVKTLAGLHAIDVTVEPYAALGRPEGYLERQIGTFLKLWPLTTQRDLPDVVRLGEWLGAHVPATQRPSFVHGDYRLGNLMLARGVPRVAAVLDWEMATLGDPLADLGYLTATWSDPATEALVLELSPVTALPGFLTKDGLVEHYVSRTGLDVSDLPWYQALALWKAAVFCEAIYTRWRNGERPGDSFGPLLEDGIPLLLDTATGLVGR